MTLIKRKCAERNRIYKKKMTNKQRNKKKKTHQGTKRGAGRMFRKIETQRGEKRLRLSVSTRRRRKKKRNPFPHTHISSLPRRRRAIPILCGSRRCCCRYSLFLPSAFISVVFQRPFPGSESDSNLFMSL